MLFLSMHAAFAQEVNDETKVYVNNYKHENVSKLINVSGCNYIGAADFANILGAVISWDNKTKTATLTFEENVNAFDADMVSFVKGERFIRVKGSKITLKNEIIMQDGRLYLPINIMPSYFETDVKYDLDKNAVLIKSEANKLVDEPDFSKINLLPQLEKAIGSDTYKLLTFSYAATEDVKNEKFLTSGKYVVFTAYEKGYITNKLHGFFYLNIYNNYAYFYPAQQKDERLMKRYADGKMYKFFQKNNGKSTAFLVAATRLMSTISSADEKNLSKYSYVGIDKPSKDYSGNLPEGEYYYYKATGKSSQDDSGFELAQNKNNMDVYLFLKKENGINIVKLPDLKLIEVVE